MTVEPCVTITIPPDPRYFRTVRLAVGGLATMAGFDVEAIEDLRIGVDELSSALVEIGDGSDLRFEVKPETDQGLRIDATVRRGSAKVDEERFTFSERILSVVADEFGFASDGGTARGWLVRAAEPDAG